MWTWLASLIGGPVVNGLIESYKAELAAGNTQERIAADLASRERAVQQRELEVEGKLRVAELGKWYEPDKLMGYAAAIYFGKLLIWDKVLALGSTDALAGWASTTANLIVMFYFGKRGFENVARILKR
jgi:hypothetical protein